MIEHCTINWGLSESKSKKNLSMVSYRMKSEGKRDYKLWQELKLEAPMFRWDMEAYGWVHILKRHLE